MILFAALFAYSAAALLDTVPFYWFWFAISWGPVTLVAQVAHCGLYLYFKHQVRSVVSPDSSPSYLVGTPVIREIHQAVVISTFCFSIVVYLTVQYIAFKGNGNVEHAVQAPYILIFVIISMVTMLTMLYAVMAQTFAVANVRRITVYFKSR
jgi:hypothetical protein